MCCPDWINGFATLLVSRLCDTVVIRARIGSRNVGGSEVRASRKALRPVRASRAILKGAMAEVLLDTF